MFDAASGVRAFNDLRSRVAGLEEREKSDEPEESGHRSGRKLKIPEPGRFSGGDNKSSNLKEWLNQVALYCSQEDYVTDKQKIVVALSRLEGAALKYMGSYFNKLEAGEDIGSWTSFRKELQSIYGMRDEREGARKELTELFKDNNLAHKDFVRYAEKFRTLARLAEYDDTLLIEKLRDVIPSNMKLLVVASKGNMANKWTDYLDELLAFYKDLYPERAQGHIFTKGNSSKDTSVPMDIDRAERKRSKKGKKGKEVNSTEKPKKYCTIHKSSGHNTEDCRQNPDNTSKSEKEKKKDKKSDYKGKGKEKASSSAKRIRAVESDSEPDSSSSEDEAPPSRHSEKSKKKKEVNSLRKGLTARIEELSEDDEILSPIRKGEPFNPADFLARYL